MNKISAVLASLLLASSAGAIAATAESHEDISKQPFGKGCAISAGGERHEPSGYLLTKAGK